MSTQPPNPKPVIVTPGVWPKTIGDAEYDITRSAVDEELPTLFDRKMSRGWKPYAMSLLGQGGTWRIHWKRLLKDRPGSGSPSVPSPAA